MEDGELSSVEAEALSLSDEIGLSVLEGLCTGAGLRDGLMHLEMRQDDEKGLVVLADGLDIAFEIAGSRKCIGSRPPGAKSLIPCPEGSDSISSAQCRSCFAAALILPCLRCTGERCTNPARRPVCVVDDNHAVYLASFGPGVLKVGVARWERRQERLLEQGARAAIIIARDDGQQVRRVERQIVRAGIRDRIPPTEKLRALTQACNSDSLGLELLQTLEEVRPRVGARWIDPETIDLKLLDLLEKQPRLVAPVPGFRLRGRLRQVAGQLIIIAADTGEDLAIDVAALIGYELRPLAEHESGGGQMALAF